MSANLLTAISSLLGWLLGQRRDGFNAAAALGAGPSGAIEDQSADLAL